VGCAISTSQGLTNRANHESKEREVLIFAMICVLILRVKSNFTSRSLQLIQKDTWVFKNYNFIVWVFHVYQIKSHIVTWANSHLL